MFNYWLTGVGRGDSGRWVEHCFPEQASAPAAHGGGWLITDSLPAAFIFSHISLTCWCFLHLPNNLLLFESLSQGLLLRQERKKNWKGVYWASRSCFSCTLKYTELIPARSHVTRNHSFANFKKLEDLGAKNERKGPVNICTWVPYGCI